MAHISKFRTPMVSPSRRRSFVGDVCAGLQQEMFFWGCDAAHPEGNLLVQFGLTRIARCHSGGEGSSRYRINWRGGTVELHSFCAGWYPQSGEGAVYIRHRERLYACSSKEPLTPGAYESEYHAASPPDAMLGTCRPLLEWVSEYESWVSAHTAEGYRHKCWMRLLSHMGGRPWLPPEKAHEWLQSFLADPGSTPRAKELLRGRRSNPDAGFRLPAGRKKVPETF